MTVTSARSPAPGSTDPSATRAGSPFGRAAEITTALGLATLPLLVPAGPGNTGPVDLWILLAVVATAAAAVRDRRVVRLPYVVPVLLAVLAALLAALARPSSSGTLTAVAQDVLLVLWAGVLANLGLQPQMLRRLVRVWAATSTVAAAVLVVAVLLGLNAVAGIVEEEGTRASLTFGDPNRAGSYFGISVMVVLASGWPAHRIGRWLAVGVLVVALVETGSNAGLVALLSGLVAVALLATVHRLGTLRGLGAALGVVGLVAVLLRGLDLPTLSEQAHASGQPLLVNTLGRASQGGDDRGLLLSENLKVYRREGLLGVGASGTKSALRAEQAQYVKEAHNDYIAALVERGPLGALALMLLLATVGVRAAALVRRHPCAALLSAVPKPQYLAAAAGSCAVAAWFHEVAHFRHVWALLGLVAAAGFVARSGSCLEDAP